MRAWAEELAPSSDFGTGGARVISFQIALLSWLLRKMQEATRLRRCHPLQKPTRPGWLQGIPGTRTLHMTGVINPSEFRHTTEKTLLYSMDELWAESGDSGYRYFDADWGRFTVGICMDLNDDTFISWLQHSADGGYWWLRGRGCVGLLGVARKEEVKTTLVAANTYGVEGDIRFSGRSVVLRERTIYAAADVSGNHAVRAVVPSTANALHP